TKALLDAERQEALLKFDRAVVSCEEGRVEEGLLMFLRTVELAEKNGLTDLARAARINIAAWPRTLPPKPRPIAHKQQPRLTAFHPAGKPSGPAGRGGELSLGKSTGKNDPPQKRMTYTAPGRFGTDLSKNFITYWTVDMSPDGKLIAAGGDDGAVTIWDIDKAEPRMSFDAVSGKGNVWSMAFVSNTMLWVNDGKIGLRRWDVSTKPPKMTELGPKPVPNPKIAPGAENVIQILALSHDCKRLYTGDRDGVVREW